jgi:hypothetical protein
MATTEPKKQLPQSKKGLQDKIVAGGKAAFITIYNTYEFHRGELDRNMILGDLLKKCSEEQKQEIYQTFEYKLLCATSHPFMVGIEEIELKIKFFKDNREELEKRGIYSTLLCSTFNGIIPELLQPSAHWNRNKYIKLFDIIIKELNYPSSDSNKITYKNQLDQTNYEIAKRKAIFDKEIANMRHCQGKRQRLEKLLDLEVTDKEEIIVREEDDKSVM